jgi:hypothetical protein
MPRKPRQPSCRRHKARNCAVVTINGQNHYLGPYDSAESHAKYADLIGKWRSTHGICPPEGASAATTQLTLTVGELNLAYWKFANGYYVKDGQPTGQLSVIKVARPAVSDVLFGDASREAAWCVRPDSSSAQMRGAACNSRSVL